MNDLLKDLEAKNRNLKSKKASLTSACYNKDGTDDHSTRLNLNLHQTSNNAKKLIPQVPLFSSSVSNKVKKSNLYRAS